MTAKRNSFMDLYRFIAMFVVMGCHQHHLSVAGFPFYHGWVFAEFFFILTGYLTASHFHHTEADGRIIRSSLRYTLRKFLSMAAFIWAAIVLEYLYQALRMLLFADASAADLLAHFAKLPLELCMLSGLTGQPLLVPGWYLSALFIVFPVFCILLQALPEKILTAVSVLLPAAGYLVIGAAGNWTFPDNLIRAMAGLLLGAFAFRMNAGFAAKLYRRAGKGLVTAVQLTTLSLPLILSVHDPRGFVFPILFCFVIGVAITLSGQSHTAGIHSRFFLYLGQISLPLYLFHWTIAGVLCSHRLPLTREARYLLFHIISILAAVFAYELLRFIKGRMGKSGGRPGQAAV